MPRFRKLNDYDHMFGSDVWWFSAQELEIGDLVFTGKSSRLVVDKEKLPKYDDYDPSIWVDTLIINTKTSMRDTVRGFSGDMKVVRNGQTIFDGRKPPKEEK